MSGEQDRVNAEVYHASAVVGWYKSNDLLARDEAVALLHHLDAIRDRDVLDIGVGTGRTTAYLEPLAARYEAVDYSAVMVDYVRSHLPHVSVRQADMRDLSAFDDDSFDAVVALANVVDAVGHADRERVLDEFTRVLRPGGVLVMNSHNYCHLPAREGPRWQFETHPVALARGTRTWWRQRAGHAKAGALREVHEDYALLTDEGHDYACLHYYVHPRAHRRILRERGYEVLDVFDRWGRPVRPGEDGAESPFLLYVARANGAKAAES